MNKEEVIKLIDGEPYYHYKYTDFLYQKLEEKDKKINKALKFIEEKSYFSYKDGIEVVAIAPTDKLKNILLGDDEE